VDPTEWKNRTDFTVSVGLGHGTREQNLKNIEHLIMLVSAIRKDPETKTMCGREEIYNLFTKTSGLLGFKDVDNYIKHPDQVKPGQAPPDPKVQMEQEKAKATQEKAKADQMKAQVAMEKIKVEREKLAQEKQDSMMEARQHMSEAQMDQLRFQWEQKEFMMEMQMKQAELELKYQELQVEYVTAQQIALGDT